MASYFSVDRIENGIASLEREDRTMVMVPLSRLPGGIGEGDVLLERDGTYSLDRAETQRRREYNRQLFERLKGGGD